MSDQKISRNPFDIEVESPFGALRVIVRPGRVAKIQCMADVDGEKRTLRPITVDGGPFLVVADMMHDGDRWCLRAFTGAPPSGGRPADLTRVRLSFVSGMGPVLDGHMRRFVERDIVEVYRERRVQDDAIQAVNDQITRRREKVRTMRRARNAAETGFASREAELRGEMEAIDTRPPVDPEADEAPSMVA